MMQMMVDVWEYGGFHTDRFKFHSGSGSAMIGPWWESIIFLSGLAGHTSFRLNAGHPAHQRVDTAPR